jgi:hypothetical protein
MGRSYTSTELPYMDRICLDRVSRKSIFDGRRKKVFEQRQYDCSEPGTSSCEKTAGYEFLAAKPQAPRMVGYFCHVPQTVGRRYRGDQAETTRMCESHSLTGGTHIIIVAVVPSEFQPFPSFLPFPCLCPWHLPQATTSKGTTTPG